MNSFSGNDVTINSWFSVSAAQLSVLNDPWRRTIAANNPATQIGLRLVINLTTITSKNLFKFSVLCCCLFYRPCYQAMLLSLMVTKLNSRGQGQPYRHSFMITTLKSADHICGQHSLFICRIEFCDQCLKLAIRGSPGHLSITSALGGQSRH